MKSLEEKFQKIGEKAVQDAESVRCDFADFVEGLHSILVEVQTRYEMALSEQRVMRREGEE